MYVRGKDTKIDCDRLVEMFSDEGADTLGVYNCNEDGIVTLEPLNSKTGTSWSISLITSVEDAIASKYPKSFRSEKDYQNFIKFVPTTQSKDEFIESELTQQSLDKGDKE